MTYFNYRIHSVETEQASYWERREFLHAWWALYREDGRWTPPEFSRLRREMDPRRNSHLARLQSKMVYMDALYRTGLRRVRTDQQEIPMTSILEQPLAAVMPIIDARRKGRTAYASLLHLAADDEAFERLHGFLIEAFSASGYRRFIGPVGLSPHLDSGVLVDSWNEWPPLHTPANPPYLPELLENRMRPMQTGRLYHADLSPSVPLPADRPATLEIIDPAQLSGDLLPLLVAATENTTAGFAPPDTIEAWYILHKLHIGTLTCCLASMDGESVGFALVGADTAGRLRLSGGGRSLLGRGRLAIARSRPVRAGRLYFCAVQPAWRRRGIGRQLWQWASREASRRGWQQLTIGPVWAPGGSLISPAVAFLESQQAIPRQTFQLFEASF